MGRGSHTGVTKSLISILQARKKDVALLFGGRDHGLKEPRTTGLYAWDRLTGLFRAGEQLCGHFQPGAGAQSSVMGTSGTSTGLWEHSQVTRMDSPSCVLPASYRAPIKLCWLWGIVLMPNS